MFVVVVVVAVVVVLRTASHGSGGVEQHLYHGLLANREVRPRKRHNPDLNRQERVYE